MPHRLSLRATLACAALALTAACAESPSAGNGPPALRSHRSRRPRCGSPAAPTWPAAPFGARSPVCQPACAASNQPYFAYPGVLQPDSTTEPHRWKLRFDAGVQTFSFGLYLSVPVPPGAGGVWMKVLAPGRDAVVGDTVVVTVQIDSASATSTATGTA